MTECGGRPRGDENPLHGWRFLSAGIRKSRDVLPGMR